jgi:hypothetical protein
MWTRTKPAGSFIASKGKEVASAEFERDSDPDLVASKGPTAFRAQDLSRRT